MNAERRKRLTDAIGKLMEFKAEVEKLDLEEMRNNLTSAKDTVAEVQGEEQEAFDNMSEKAQEGEKGQRTEEIAGALDEVAGEIDDLLTEVNNLSWLGNVDDIVAKIEENKE